jgi:hypothetical protein
MRMVKMGVAAATAAALLGWAAPARAEVRDTEIVAKHEPSSLAIVAKDAFFGGLAGAAVGGGVVLIQNGGTNVKPGYNWGRTLALSTGIGLVAGAAIGIIDVAIQPRPAPGVVVTDGQADRLAWAEQSGTQTMSVPVLRF